MSPERFVVDSNVLISAALLADSVPARFLTQVLNQGRLVFCPETFDELRSRLWRPKFDRYVSLEDRKLFLRDLQAVAEWVDLPPVSGPAYCADPDDEKFLRLALAAKAAALVSGDRDLTSLHDVAGVPVLTPAQALRRFK